MTTVNFPQEAKKFATPTIRIVHIYGIIQTIRKHVIAEDALAGAGEGIGIQESAYLRIIISALEIIQPGFSLS